MIKKNDVCKIENKSANKVSIALYKTTTTWTIEPDDTLEFPIASAEMGLFYLKQANKDLTVTITTPQASK